MSLQMLSSGERPGSSRAELHRLSPAGLAIEASNGEWTLTPHLRLLNRKLVAAATGRLPRLIVTMPPRHGKSELCSHWLPAWFLGTWPWKRIIVASYESDFAATWGRKSRDTLEERGPDLFGVRLRSDTSAANRWEIERLAGHGATQRHGRWRRTGGGMVTAGVEGAITGRGAHLLLIDDPVKSAKESLSATYRKTAWDFYQATARTRLEPGGAIVLIMTRWHEEDLAGTLVKKMNEDPAFERWEILHLPAIATKDEPEYPHGIGRQLGDALWPERYPRAVLDETMNSIERYWWMALYQGEPIKPGGLGNFRASWFEVVAATPANMLRVRYWDMASTEVHDDNRDPDWTVGCLIGLSEEGQWFIEDIVRFRASPLDTERKIKETAVLDRNKLGNIPIRMEKEPGSSGKSMIDYYRRRILPGFEFDGVASTGPKQLRASPLAAAAQANNVKLLVGDWVQDFKAEAELFPFGDHDDQIDAASGGMNFLSQLVAGPSQIVSPAAIRLPGPFR